MQIHGAHHGRGEAPPAWAPMNSQSLLSGRTDSSHICDRWCSPNRLTGFITLEDKMESLKTRTTTKTPILFIVICSLWGIKLENQKFLNAIQRKNPFEI